MLPLRIAALVFLFVGVDPLISYSASTESTGSRVNPHTHTHQHPPPLSCVCVMSRRKPKRATTLYKKKAKLKKKTNDFCIWGIGSWRHATPIASRLDVVVCAAFDSFAPCNRIGIISSPPPPVLLLLRVLPQSTAALLFSCPFDVWK